MKIPPGFNAAALARQLNPGGSEETKLRQACQDFEAIITGLMLKTMRSTVPEDSLFGTSNQKEIYQSLFDEELVKTIADSGKNIGIGDMLYEQLSRRLKLEK